MDPPETATYYITQLCPDHIETTHLYQLSPLDAVYVNDCLALVDSIKETVRGITVKAGGWKVQAPATTQITCATRYHKKKVPVKLRRILASEAREGDVITTRSVDTCMQKITNVLYSDSFACISAVPTVAQLHLRWHISRLCYNYVFKVEGGSDACDQ